MRVRLNIESSNSATLELDGKPAEKITEMYSEGPAFTGVSAGLIDSLDASRTGAKALKIKLVPYRGVLAGRILATDFKIVALPYVLNLNRVPA
jgi:hypothetical protein